MRSLPELVTNTLLFLAVSIKYFQVKLLFLFEDIWYGACIYKNGRIESKEFVTIALVCVAWNRAPDELERGRESYPESSTRRTMKEEKQVDGRRRLGW